MKPDSEAQRWAFIGSRRKYNVWASLFVQFLKKVRKKERKKERKTKKIWNTFDQKYSKNYIVKLYYNLKYKKYICI